jgi:hypothetical protein
MDPSFLIAIIEVFRDNPLAIAVCEKVYRSSRNDTNEIWSQAFKKSTPAFNFMNRE